MNPLDCIDFGWVMSPSGEAYVALELGLRQSVKKSSSEGAALAWC